MRQMIMETFKPKDTNLEILALIAKELDAGRRDTSYKDPLSIPDKDVTSEPDVESDVLIVDCLNRFNNAAVILRPIFAFVPT